MRTNIPFFSRTPSLSRRIAWRVGLGVVVLIFAIFLVICAMIWKPGALQVYRGIAEQAAEAVSLREGRLALDPTLLPRRMREAPENAWLVVADDAGNTLTWGKPPGEYRSLLGMLTLLSDSDLRSPDPRLAATLSVEEREGGRVRVIVGGVPDEGIIGLFGPLFYFIGLWLALPIAAAILLLVPWIVRRGLSGIGKVAEQASTLDMNHRSKPLDAGAVPSELKPLIDSFNQALERIWDAAEARDRFLGNAAHELRLPITIVRARASALPAGTAKTGLLSDIARLENISEQLLDLQRVDRGLMAHQPLDLVEVCRDVGEDIAPLLIKAGYAFSFDAPQTPVLALGDAGALQRVIMNLLQNAMVHGGGAGEIALSVSPDGRISVSDAGPGIAEEDYSQIFSPFYRLNPAAQGSGLGLHLAREVVIQHKGSIRVSRADQGGARFCVQLPVARAQTQGT
ncbi:sensor histidine kinase [Pseudomonas sp. CGJS7]|uniref:sensor histidine kinase n=1 Tax=Pseudomonas sp. CGJS7 TaxID=3109348 RepID=UPI00300BDD70